MTATEKYHAVLEGKMKEGEFVRQMRQAFPQYITQWNGYKDSVAILKQKQMIFEKKEVKKDITKLADSFPIEAIERGIDIELESAGIDSTGAVSKDEYMKAKRTAVTNLQKDANHYLNLISGESAKVDKNDKMKETKKMSVTCLFEIIQLDCLRNVVSEQDSFHPKNNVPECFLFE